MIEHLPAELRDRFTDIREIDLSVQSKCFTFYHHQHEHVLFSTTQSRQGSLNLLKQLLVVTLYFLSLDRVDLLDGRCKAFFAQCKKNPDSQQVEFEKIKEEYKKVIEDASEKIQVAEDCYGLVDRYLRKLDEELHKFKMELEADNRGITEVLEKHSLEMDAAPTMVNLKENRHPKKLVSSEKLP